MLMAARLLALRLLLLPGMWAIPGHRGATPSPGEPSLQLTGSGCRCTGMLEVKWKGRWSRVCRDSLSEAGTDNICQWLGCGPPIAKPLARIFTSGKEPHAWLLRCLRPVATPLGCHWVPGNCTEHAVLACSEPVQTTPEPPLAPPTTSPEPTGPPRLRLVDGNFSCSGFVELHRQGLWGAVAGSQGIWPKLATRICQALSCGSAIDSRSHAKPERGSHLPVRWEAVESCESRPLLDCFNRTSARWGKAPAFVLCSGSQPQALWRLVAGPTPCEGDVEVFHKGQWQVLCDDWAQRAKRGRQLCQHLRCGNLSSSTEVRDPPSTGVTCKVPTLHLCPASLGTPQTCSRTRVVCQDSKPHPTGVAAGTVVSICLALLLFGILSLICGPPAYRRLMKRSSLQKEAAPVDRPHGTQPDGLLPSQQHRHPEATGRGAAGAGRGQRLRSAPPEELLPLGLPSPGRCVQNFQPSGQLLRQRLRPALCPQSVTPSLGRPGPQAKPSPPPATQRCPQGGHARDSKAVQLLN